MPIPISISPLPLPLLSPPHFNHDGDDGDDDHPTISVVHSDILETHILSRLDGPALASTASTSSQLRLLSTQDQLWRHICIATWPSVTDLQLRQSIAGFTAGHRSFFSDVFPLLDCSSLQYNHDCTPSHSTETQLISAVDIHYNNKLLFSKTQSIDADSNWFFCSPFRVDLIDLRDSIPTTLKNSGDGDDEDEEEKLQNLEENLTLSWIVIDPIKKRAANISSRKPVKVHRHWLSGEIQIRYAIIMAGESSKRWESELVECAVVVNLGQKEEEEEEKEMNITEVSLQMLDMEGKHLNGKESLVILQEAIENGKRKKGKEEEGKEKYEEYKEIKKKKMMKKEKMDNALDMFCVASGISILFAFWFFILFK